MACNPFCGDEEKLPDAHPVTECALKARI